MLLSTHNLERKKSKWGMNKKSMVVCVEHSTVSIQSATEKINGGVLWIKEKNYICVTRHNRDSSLL